MPNERAKQIEASARSSDKRTFEEKNANDGDLRIRAQNRHYVGWRPQCAQCSARFKSFYLNRRYCCIKHVDDRV